MDPTIKTTQSQREMLSQIDWVRLPSPGERLCGVGRSTIYSLIESGKIKSSKVGKIRLVHLPSLISLIENSPN